MSLESNEPQQGEPGGGGGSSARDRAEVRLFPPATC